MTDTIDPGHVNETHVLRALTVFSKEVQDGLGDKTLRPDDALHAVEMALNYVGVLQQLRKREEPRE